MRRPVLLLVAVAAALAPGLRERPAAAPQESRYNLISIVTDDQAEWSVGAYGNRESRTPHMDRLAREGARFLNAFVPTPVCSPSRASFLTGLYGTQVGITDWISPQQAARGLGLEPQFVTWPEVLQQHGYRTALLGKWHLGMQPQFHPTKHGFDHFYGFLGGGNTPVNPTLEVSGREQQVEGPLPDRLADEAIGFVKGHRDRPFALLLHFRAPHLPYGPVPPEDEAPFRSLDPSVPTLPGLDIPHVKRLTREYYASVHSVDRNIGRLLAALDDLDLTRRTIVLFTSDHGYMIGHHLLHAKGNGFWIAGGVNGPKRPNMFEESIRVPLLVRWPGVVQPGTELREMVSGIDTFPSVLGMLGIAAPAPARHEGRDFSPLLRGERVAWRDRVFGQYDLHNGGLAHMRMVRTDRWKLVRHHFSTGLDELYDLQADPGEHRNLYNREEARPIRDELQQSLSGWQQAIGDPILELRKGLVRSAPVGPAPFAPHTSALHSMSTSH